MRAAKAVGAGGGRRLVSAGATGALLAASLFHVKRIRGVHRPASRSSSRCPASPCCCSTPARTWTSGPSTSSSSPTWARPSWRPSTASRGRASALLSIGEEPKKGTDDVVAAHEQLAEGTLDFAGNVEGTDLAAGAADVVVTDGFTGNVALKLMEGTAKTVAGAVGDAIRAASCRRLGGLLVRAAWRAARAARPEHDGRRDPARGAPPGGGRPREIDRGGDRQRGPIGAARPMRTWSSGPAALAEGGALRSAPAASFARSHD